MRDSLRPVLEIHERHVGGAGNDAAAAQRGNSRRRLAKPVLQDRKVVRAEIPDDAHIGLMQAEIHTARRDEVDVAELTRPDQLLDRHDRRAVEERMPGHEDEAETGREPEQALRLARRRGEGLLDEHVLAGFERRLGELEVCRDRCGDRDGVDLGVGEDVPEARGAAKGREAAPDRVDGGAAGVAYHDRVCAVHLVEVPHEVGPPVAEADDGHPHRQVVRSCPAGSRAALEGRAHAAPFPRRTAKGVRTRSRRSRPSDQPRA